MPRSTQIVPKYTFPHEEVYINDNSAQDLTEPTPQVTDYPYICVFCGPKGIDNKLVNIRSLADHRKTFGTTNFAKYGQPQLMPEAILKQEDTSTWSMRLMPDDATYSNSILSLWYKADKDEKAFRIRFTTKSLSPNDNFDIADLGDEEMRKVLADRETVIDLGNRTDGQEIDGKYVDDEGYTQVPLICFTSIGRGVYGDQLRWRITQNSDAERTSGKKMYIFEVLDLTDGATIVNSHAASLVSTTSNGSSLFINDVMEDADIEDLNMWIHVYEENVNSLYEAYANFCAEMIAEDPTTPITVPEVYEFDPLFGYAVTKNGVRITPKEPFIKFAIKRTSEVEIQLSKTIVKIPDDTEQQLGVSASELQDDVVFLDDGKVHGTFKYKSNFTQFSDNVEEQSGNYIYLDMGSKYAGKQVTCQRTSNGGGTEVTSTDGWWILRLTDGCQTRYKLSVKDDPSLPDIILDFCEADLETEHKAMDAASINGQQKLAWDTAQNAYKISTYGATKISTTEKILGDYTETDIIEISNIAGNSLLNGSDGAFGDPDPEVVQNAMNEMYERAFNGAVDRMILSSNRVGSMALFDANFPLNIKYALVKLAMFRESGIVYLDTGIQETLGEADIYTFEANYEPIDTIIEDFENFSSAWLVSVNTQWYRIQEESTGKRIPVTITYFLASTDANVMAQSATSFVARVDSYATLEGHVKNSLTPAIEEFDTDLKQALYDARINYFEAVGENRFVRSTQSCYVKANSDLLEENNVKALLWWKKTLTEEARANRYQITNPTVRSDFKAYLLEKYDYVIGPIFTSMTIDYKSNEYEFKRNIVHLYSSVQLPTLSKLTLIEIDVNQREYQADESDEATE